MCSVSHVQLSATPLVALHQAPLSVEFSRQEHWRGMPFPSSRDVPDPGIEPTSLASSVLAGKFSTDANSLGSPYIHSTSTLLIVLFKLICLFIFFSEHLFHTLLSLDSLLGIRNTVLNKQNPCLSWTLYSRGANNK